MRATPAHLEANRPSLSAGSLAKARISQDVKLGRVCGDHKRARMINMKDPCQCQNTTAERLAPAGLWQRRNGPRHESIHSRTSDYGCHGWIYGHIWPQANGFQLSISSFLGLPGITSASCLKPRGLDPPRAIVSVGAERSWFYCSLEAFLQWISGLVTNSPGRIQC